MMIQYRVYLRAELGKLSRRRNAVRFAEKIPHDVLATCGLPTSADEITTRMVSQDAVDAFVTALRDQEVQRLVEAYSRNVRTYAFFFSIWRKNDVFKKLRGSVTWHEADIPVDLIELQQAEPALGDLFRSNVYSLRRIATDDRILASEPYSHHGPGEPVHYATCLAIKRGDTYRIFDGMHRAIQMVRNGQATVRLCYAERA